MVGVFATRKESMPAGDVRAVWRAAFARDRILQARAEHLAKHPEAGSALATNGIAFPHLMNGDQTPTSRIPKELMQRPIDPDQSTDVTLQDEADRLAFLDEVVNSIVKNGASHTRVLMRRMGFSSPEISAFMRQSRKELGESVGMDVDEHRAVSVRRHEELFRLSLESLDYKTALSSQKSLDRVTGVVSDEGTGAMSELAFVAELVTKGDLGIQKIIDADFTSSEPRDAELIAAADVRGKTLEPSDAAED